MPAEAHRPGDLERFRARPVDGVLPRFVGPSPAHSEIVEAARLVRAGRVYDLDAGRWHGMDVYDTSPAFEVTTVCTPSDLRRSGHAPDLVEAAGGIGWIDEAVRGSVHSGTHVEGLCHLTFGPEDAWHGGGRATTDVGEHGAMRDDGASIPPLVCRGVLVDVAGLHGGGPPAPGLRIGPAELADALDRTGAELRPGDCALVRTGFMQVWQTEAARDHAGAGIDLAGAQWLIDRGVVAIGADTDGVEASPSGIEDPLPVHRLVLHELGMHLIEAVYLEGLAADGVSEFLFVCAGVRIRGTSGAPARPLAIV